MEGFLSHTEKVAEFYQQRRDMMLKAAEKWLTGEHHNSHAGQAVFKSFDQLQSVSMYSSFDHRHRLSLILMLLPSKWKARLEC